MKKILIILALGFTLTGCAALQNQKANWDACMADPDCKKHAQEAFAKGQVIGSLAGGVVPVPGAGTAGGLGLGSLFLLIAALSGGAALKKKQTPEVSNTTVTN